jgi:hypothetical protein
MAKVTFTDDLNIRPARQNFPKITKLQKGDKLRIQLVDPSDIDVEFVHNLEAPIIENGAGVKGADGKWKMRYMGSPLSFGDYAELTQSGLDTNNCPISKFAKKHPDWVSYPRRKFATHVIQYKTRPGSYKLSTPYQVEHKVWVFNDNTFVKLKEFADSWGDLRKHDIYLECVNAQFQQYELAVAPDAAWITEGTDSTKHTMDIYNGGKEEFSDLSGAIGQKKERRWVEEDLNEIEEAWKIVLGVGNSETSLISEDLSLDELVGSSTPSEASTDSDDSSEGELDFEALIAGMKD